MFDRSSISRVAAALVAALGLAACASAPRPPAPSAQAAPVPVAVDQPAAPAAVAPAPPSAAEQRARERGWAYLVDRLAADGLPRERVARAFADPRVPAFDGLFFSPRPRESRAQYRGYLTRRSVDGAERCAAANADALEAAERATGVSASVVAAILHVESHCGTNTGKALVLHRLARLAMANEPQNMARNLARWSGPSGQIDAALAEALRERGRYLEDVFYPEVRATFEAADRMAIDPLEIRGSSAGAFGLPQFLPGSFVAFGSDGDGDGRVSLYDPADAAASCARFLASHGWKPGLTRGQQRQVIWHYNRSDAYIDTVLALAERIRRGGVLRVSVATTTTAAFSATRHP